MKSQKGGDEKLTGRHGCGVGLGAVDGFQFAEEVGEAVKGGYGAEQARLSMAG